MSFAVVDAVIPAVSIFVAIRVLSHLVHNATFHFGCDVRRYNRQQQLLLLLAFIFQLDALVNKLLSTRKYFNMFRFELIAILRRENNKEYGY